MKILMEIDESIAEDEVIIRCRELNDEMVSLQRQISEAVNQKMQLHVAKSDKEYFITLEEILFLETADQMIAVHTSDDIYATKQKMYELEELLPGLQHGLPNNPGIQVHKQTEIHLHQFPRFQ